MSISVDYQSAPPSDILFRPDGGQDMALIDVETEG
jgi:hypothetical protein